MAMVLKTSLQLQVMAKVARKITVKLRHHQSVVLRNVVLSASPLDSGWLLHTK